MMYSNYQVYNRMKMLTIKKLAELRKKLEETEPAEKSDSFLIHDQLTLKELLTVCESMDFPVTIITEVGSRFEIKKTSSLQKEK